MFGDLDLFTPEKERVWPSVLFGTCHFRPVVSGLFLWRVPLCWRLSSGSRDTTKLRKRTQNFSDTQDTPL
jgi:hypothetical protein